MIDKGHNTYESCLRICVARVHVACSGPANFQARSKKVQNEIQGAG